MNKREFRAVLKELGLGTASQATVRALGVTVTQIQRLASGRQRVTRQLELLLHMYRKHGIPKQVPGE
jgi:plasmid maintenance system antidote protein VapI